MDDVVYSKTAEWLIKAGVPMVSVVLGAAAAVCLTKAAVAWKSDPSEPDNAKLFLLYAILLLIPALAFTLAYGLVYGLKP